MINEIQSLTKRLNKYSHEYYNLNSPSISDKEYDLLFDKLKNLESKADYRLANSPTQTIGYKVIGKLQKRVHPTPLLSLDKTKSIDKIIEWQKNKPIICMYKADGLTVEIVYEDGKFVGGYTRGNGEIGEDISHNCKTFMNLPLEIPFKEKLRIVGEAVIHKDDFNKINSALSNDEKYATPRNLAAGSARQLSSEICSKRNVYFYAFGILECNKIISDSKKESFLTLESWGITTITFLYMEKINRDIIDTFTNTAKQSKIPVDGLVFSFDSVKYSNSLGETSHHPLHSIAYKFDDEIKETVLRTIIWNTTRTGQINPTAIFDTVILDNTEVSRASLHNLSFIRDLELNIGCRILVSKRNMIIPYIESNLDKNKGELLIPSICPSCGNKTYVENTGTADFLFCKNKKCPDRIIDKFIHFAKRDCMNIEGMSEATIEKFIAAGFLKTFDDIYRLENFKNEIINMEGWGIKSYDNLIESITNSKNATLSNFIYALGIPRIGRFTSGIIAKYFDNSWSKFEKALANDFDFTIIKGFGDTTNNALHIWYKDKDEQGMICGLLDGIIEFIDEDKKVGNKTLEGITFVVTGKLNNFSNRNEIQRLIESMGGKLSGSISKKTNYLINNDAESDSNKNKRAKKLGVKIISEEEFMKLIKELLTNEI